MTTSRTEAPGPYAVLFVFITVLIDMLGFGIVMPVLPKLIETISGRDLAGASLLGGWLFFAYGGMQFLCGPVIGNLSDSVGRRPVLLLAVAGLALDYMLTAFAPNMIWLFVGRTVAGVCGASYVTANAYLADITKPEERAKAFGMIGAAFGLGFVAGPAIGGVLGLFGARVPFFAAAAFSIGNFLFGYFALPETLKLENRRPFAWRRANPFGALKVFSQYRGVLKLAVAVFVYSMAGAVYPATWAFWGIARFEWSELAIGLTLAAFGIITAITQGFLTGPIVARFGERATMIFGLAMASIVPVGFGIAPGLIAVLVLLVFHAPEGFVYPTMTALMSRQAPADAQGELQGGIASLQSLGMLLGSLFFAQVFGFFLSPAAPFLSTSVAFGLAAVATAAILVFVLVWTKPQSTLP